MRILTNDLASRYLKVNFESVKLLVPGKLGKLG